MYPNVQLQDIAMLNAAHTNVQIRNESDQKTLEKSNCSICLDMVKLPGVICVTCQSVLCETCYDGMNIGKRCPCCRTKMNKQQIPKFQEDFIRALQFNCYKAECKESKLKMSYDEYFEHLKHHGKFKKIACLLGCNQEMTYN